MADDLTTMVAFAVPTLAVLVASFLFAVAQISKPRFRSGQTPKQLYRFKWDAQGFILNEFGQRQLLCASGMVFTPTSEDARQVALDSLSRSVKRTGMVKIESVQVDIRPDLGQRAL